ncbi:tRNA 4-thiouridine(8) synthase ThiI [Candidatus Aerophobetes bacterium]|uniref:tRNA 4-thiouridine(8) synthase ThiI n=1 Tax=Aerophobetes bacterium TaxID=2030807 RepID=A0A497E3N8_UNCAE|nr:MAG: tRNA 4-thiouridine(8) synthase ThiI [Candidatus Aerophobetes bacterium]
MKALSLFSGGLDSVLATRLIQEQGIQVEGVCFTSTFFDAEKAIKAAKRIRIPLHTIDLTEELLSIIKSPLYGFGKGANPCIDCHILMVKKAGLLMKKIGAQFLITGEVLGERPKSQNRWALKVVAERSGWGDYLLRPLTAKNLPPTLPERRGWVNREKLKGIKGRSRRIQLEMAKEMGIEDFSSPAGGCLLTDPTFSRRVKDLLLRGKLNLNEVELLKIGRHFRLGEGAKLIVGRNRKENEELLRLARAGDICLRVVGFPGPVGLLRGKEKDEVVRMAARIVTRYSDAPFKEVKTEYCELFEKEKRCLIVTPLPDEEIEKLRI